MDHEFSTRLGHFYELAIKRGILTYLDFCLAPKERKQKQFRNRLPQQWFDLSLHSVMKAMEDHQTSSITAKKTLSTLLEATHVQGFFHGQTVTKLILMRMNASHDPHCLGEIRGTLAVHGVYAPLDLEDIQGNEQEDRFTSRVRTFVDGFGIEDQEIIAGYRKTGHPIQADCILLLGNGNENHLFVIEVSQSQIFDVLNEKYDFRDQYIHQLMVRNEIASFRKKSAFNIVNMEGNAAIFDAADSMAYYLAPFVTGDKTAFKLFQACSYATKLAPVLIRHWDKIFEKKKHYKDKPLLVHAMALTNLGIEALASPFATPFCPENGTSQSWKLMEVLGSLYEHGKQSTPQGTYLKTQTRSTCRVTRHMLKHLEGLIGNPEQSAKFLSEKTNKYPKIFRDLHDKLSRGQYLSPNYGSSLSCLLTKTATVAEEVDGVLNPSDKLNESDVRKWLDIKDKPKAKAFFDAEDPDEEILTQAHKLGELHLRNLHHAAIRCFLSSHASPDGNPIRVLCLEGHPGIGKTTAIREAVQQSSEGILMFYASPRILINESVCEDFAQVYEGQSPIVSITTNDNLRSGFGFYLKERSPELYELKRRRRELQKVVVCRGGPPCNPSVPPEIYRLTPDEENALLEENLNRKIRVQNIDDQNDRISAENKGGVLETLFLAARELTHKEGVTRLVITSSLQAYRQTAQKGKHVNSTAAHFGKIFRTSFNEAARNWDEWRGKEFHEALSERYEFAQKIPHILVMIDEVTGDGAGVLMANDLYRILYIELVAPFQHASKPCPFRITFILSDASLTNERTMAAFLRKAHYADDVRAGTVFVDRMPKCAPFQIADHPILIGGRNNPSAKPQTEWKQMAEALHVMASAFPARKAEFVYHFNDMQYQMPDNKSSFLLEKKEFERNQLVKIALDALRKRHNSGQQVMVYVQDKKELEEIQKLILVEAHPHILNPRDIEIVTSDSMRSRESKAKFLRYRDRKKLFLSTSTASRGISFPRLTCILAHVQTFNIEQGLAEINQLIYRCRGKIEKSEDDPIKWPEYGDSLDKEIHILVSNYRHSEDPAKDSGVSALQEERQIQNSIAILAMIRGAILTRIRGEAGLGHRKVAVVPVGEIGDEPVGAGIFEAVRNFATGARTHRMTAQTRKTIETATHLIRKIFNRDAAKIRPRTNFKVAPRPFLIEHFWEPSPHKSPGPGRAALHWGKPLIPKDVEDTKTMITNDLDFLVGSVWMSRLSNERAIDEEFHFDFMDPSLFRDMQCLRHTLIELTRNHKNAPPEIKANARKILSILDLYHDTHSQNGNSKSQKNLSEGLRKHDLWVVTPSTYNLCKETVFDEEDHSLERLQKAQAEWLDILWNRARLHGRATLVAPFTTHYKDVPFAMFHFRGDPTGMGRVSDPDNVLTTHAFNVFNLLLLTQDSGS